MEQNHVEVSKTIELIKKRLNIYSIQCRFKSTYTPILSTLIDEEGYTTSIEAEFAFEKGNLSLCRNVSASIVKTKTGDYPINNGLIWDSKTSQYTIQIEKTTKNSPFLKWFYSRYLKTQFLNNNHGTPRYFLACYYLYKGKPYIRNMFKKENNIHITLGKTPFSDKANEDYNGFGYFGDPRYHIGYLNPNLGSTKLSIPYKHLSEFLDKEGYYYLTHKEGNTVLWHGAFFEDIGALATEIWIDAEENIRRIKLGFFPLLVTPFSLEEVKKILKIEEVNCDSFSQIFSELEFYDFKEFDNGIRVPLLSIRTDYVEINDTEYTSEEIDKLIHFGEAYKKGEIDKPTYRLLCAPFRRTKKMREVALQIYPETLSINQDIPEETFIPPEVTATREELYSTEASNKENTITSWYSRYYSLLFIGTCILITMVLFVFTKKYLGWSF